MSFRAIAIVHHPHTLSHEPIHCPLLGSIPTPSNMSVTGPDPPWNPSTHRSVSLPAIHCIYLPPWTTVICTYTHCRPPTHNCSPNPPTPTTQLCMNNCPLICLPRPPPPGRQPTCLPGHPCITFTCTYPAIHLHPTHFNNSSLLPPSIYLPEHWPIYLLPKSIYPTTHLSTSLSIHFSRHPPIHSPYTTK